MAEIRLDTPHACREEMERCSNGMAKLLPDFISKREEQGRVAEQMEIAEALAAIHVAADHERITATEMKARVVQRLDETGSGPIRVRKHELAAEIDIIERRYRILEKRLSAAQSALKDHQSEAQMGGYGQ